MLSLAFTTKTAKEPLAENKGSQDSSHTLVFAQIAEGKEWHLRTVGILPDQFSKRGRVVSKNFHSWLKCLNCFRACLEARSVTSLGAAITKIRLAIRLAIMNTLH